MGRGGLLIGTSIAFVTISYLPFLTMDRYHMPVLFAFALLAAHSLGKPANNRRVNVNDISDQTRRLAAGE